MDAIKTGKFISEIRKELNMTQKQLADELGISDKTISKWECGKGMPDIEMIGPLCQCLHINVNELISGERLSEKNYSDYAEGNMISLMKESKEAQKNNVRIVIKCILGIIAVIMILVFMILISGLEVRNITNFLDTPSLVLITAFTIVILWAAGRGQDLCRAILLVMSGKEAVSEDEIEAAVEAVRITRKAMLYSSIFIATFSFIVILHHLDDPAFLGPQLAVAILTVFYGIAGAMITLPIESRLKA